MNVVQVEAGAPYEVQIERGLMDRAGEALLRLMGGACSVAVLTDDTVDGLYGERVQQALQRSGFRVCRFAMPHGEAHKTLTSWAQMLSFLARQRLTRTDCVVALGGGVPGDTAGFAAACYLRGVGYVQIPTTLLAMVDSSVGGKTAVDLDMGKNLAGAFYQPRLVLCDPDALATLPGGVLADGVAEALKYGVLGDEALFDVLCQEDWQDNMEWVIERCVAAKAALVRDDERDRGSRRLLNLGHTLGHAVEKCSGYAVTHGHAVAVGMVWAARLSRRLGLCQAEVEQRIARALRQNNLPTDAPYTPKQLCEVALSDKKREGERIAFVLPLRVGECVIRSVQARDLLRWVELAVNP